MIKTPELVFHCLKLHAWPVHHQNPWNKSFDKRGLFSKPGPATKWREKTVQKNKKGSKQFRNILNSKNSHLSQQNIRKLAQVKTYALLTGSVNTPDHRCEN